MFEVAGDTVTVADMMLLIVTVDEIGPLVSVVPGSK